MYTTCFHCLPSGQRNLLLQFVRHCKTWFITFRQNTLKLSFMFHFRFSVPEHRTKINAAHCTFPQPSPQPPTSCDYVIFVRTHFSNSLSDLDPYCAVKLKLFWKQLWEEDVFLLLWVEICSAVKHPSQSTDKLWPALLVLTHIYLTFVARLAAAWLNWHEIWLRH